MKNLKNELFKKFQVDKLSKDASNLITGGGPGDSESGHTDCTNTYGPDCGDVLTDFLTDTIETQVESDSCLAPDGGY